MSSTQDLMDDAGLTKDYLLAQLKQQIEKGTPTVKSDMLKTALKMRDMLPSQRAMPLGGLLPGGYMGGFSALSGGVPFPEVPTNRLNAVEVEAEVLNAPDESGNAQEDGS